MKYAYVLKFDAIFCFDYLLCNNTFSLISEVTNTFGQII